MSQGDTRRDFIKGALAAGVAGNAGLSAFGAASPAAGAKRGRHQPRIMFYHDGRHPLLYMYEPPMQKEELESVVDDLAGTPVEALMFCLGDGRTMLHDTKAGELWGHYVDKWPHIIFRRTYQNAKGLIAEGTDPLLTTGRTQGLSGADHVAERRIVDPFGLLGCTQHGAIECRNRHQDRRAVPLYGG